MAADRDRLGEIRPVIELQDRHPTRWILCKEIRRAALTRENIDILQFKFDALFRREDANPARIWSHFMIVKLHDTCHLTTTLPIRSCTGSLRRSQTALVGERISAIGRTIRPSR